MPAIALSYVHDELHFGMDVAVDLEGSGGGKGFGNILARVFFVAVETEARTLGVDLVDEFIRVGEDQAFAAVDGDLARVKGASLLNDGVDLVHGKGGCRGQHDQRQKVSH